MAAYAAVVPLVQLLHPDQYPLDQNSEIKSLYGKVSFLQETLETITFVPKKYREDVKKVDGQIREAIYDAQDNVELFIFNQISPSDTPAEESSTPPILWPETVKKVDRAVVVAKKIADSIAQDPLAQDVLSEAAPTPKPASRPKLNRKPIGQEKDFKRLREELLKEDSKRQVLPVTGLPGIGKTTLAQSLYEDSKIVGSFGVRAWVTVTREYQISEIFTKILQSVETKSQKAGTREVKESAQQLPDVLHQTLFNAKYLIVVDDMWDINVWDKIIMSFPDNRNGSRIVLTTRDKDIAKHASREFIHVMQPLDDENSWKLLSERAFDGGECPPHLKDVGFKIAQNCRGLPLSLTVVGGLLSQERMTEKYWATIQEDTLAAAAKGDDSYLDILSLSYSHLPGKLKGCFLYMGAFPEDSEILVSKLVRLWVAEGFLKPPINILDIEQVAKESLQNLVDRNLLMIRKLTSAGQTKSCRMHDTLRELATQECDKEKFFHSRKRYHQELAPDTDSQRRLSVHKNILMCMQDVYKSYISLKHARSLLYAAAHHHHPMPFCLTFDLLRVLDAFTVYFIQFPNEILKLIHLRYLSFTYNGKLMSSLSKLRKLQTLIVLRHPKIIFLGASFLPAEIWDMPELRHLLITETDLPDPSSWIALSQNPILLKNLQSLSNVNASTCTLKVLQNMPNLKKLGMWTHEGRGVMGLFLGELQQLESFKFTVLNPIPKSHIEFKPDFSFPMTLTRLSLSGCGLPWKYITVIAQLPSLEVLKLRELAFQGDEWSPKENEFGKLKFLLIEYLDFRKWNAVDSHFPMLESLMIRHCYELEKIPSEIGLIGYIELIELVDCSPDAVESAEEIRDYLVDTYGEEHSRKVRIYSSYE